MKKKLLTLLVLVFTIFGLASCKTDNPSTDGNQNQGEVNPDSGDQGSGDNKPDGGETKPETGDRVAQTYGYTFENGDITASKSQTNVVNGLSWEYGKATHIGFDAIKGIQFGSKNKPQTTPLNIVADFKEEVIIQNFALELAVGSGGSSKYTVSFDNEYSKSEDFKNTDVKEFIVLDLNEKTSKFTITITSTARAMYLKSISFTCLTVKNSSLKLENTLGEVKPDEIPAPKYDLVTIEEYYKGFNLNLTGDALRKELDTKNAIKTKYSYGSASFILQYTDESIDDKNKIYALYDGALYDKKWLAGKLWNKEHVWACSHMTNGGESRPDSNTVNHMSDLHNLRVSTDIVNSSRGNDYFSILKTSGNYFNPNSVAPKGHDFRGDVARILLYMYVEYDFLILNDNPEANASVSMGLLTELLAWHEEDKVDAFEIQRNNRIYEYQGNRNPFIDHPELANQLF